MPIRSVPGCLLTVLAVCTLATAGLGVARLDPYDLGQHARMLRGLPVALCVLGIGALAWAGLALAEGRVGVRATRVVALLALVAAPGGLHAAEAAFWEPRGLRTLWPADGLGEWRGLVGGDCGYVSLVRLRFDASGQGVGRAMRPTQSSPLLTVALLVGSFDGPDAAPVRARRLGPSAEVLLDGGRWIETVRIVRP